MLLKRAVIIIPVFFLVCVTAYGQGGFSFVFLPDLHLDGSPSSRSAFDKLATEVNGLSPDFIITGGDMIYTAKDASIERAGELFGLWADARSQFNAPVYEVKGNHEVCSVLPESGVDPQHPLWGNGMYEQLIGERYYSFGLSGWKFIILDSFETDADKRKYSNRYDPAQLEWLDGEIASTSPKTPVVLVTHAPLVNPKAMFKSSEQALKEGGEQILTKFKNHNLRLILQAHNHLYMDLLSRGVRIVSGGSPMPLPGLNKRDRGIVQVRVNGADCEITFIKH